MWKSDHVLRKLLSLLWHRHDIMLHSQFHQFLDQQHEFFYLYMLLLILNHPNSNRHWIQYLDDNQYVQVLHQFQHSKWQLDCQNQTLKVHLMQLDAIKLNQLYVDDKVSQQRVRLMFLISLRLEFAIPLNKKNKIIIMCDSYC